MLVVLGVSWTQAWTRRNRRSGWGLPGEKDKGCFESVCRGTPVVLDQSVKWVRKWIVNGFLMKLNNCGGNGRARELGGLEMVVRDCSDDLTGSGPLV